MAHTCRRGNKTHTYIYSDQGSYEPLAQITADADKGREREILYYHCDQIGVPRALTDAAGHTVWRGRYGAWGGLEGEEKAEGIHQPLRLQNQYCDEETGLHYNFFRYYDPVLGRFISQDPIGLAGGLNAYRFAPNVQTWVDPLGLSPRKPKNLLPDGARSGKFGPKNGTLRKFENGKLTQIRSYDRNGNPVRDIDFGHNHTGTGDPHVHDWEYRGKRAPFKSRGSPRRLTGLERLLLAISRSCDSKCVSGLTKLGTRLLGGLALLLTPNTISPCQDLDYIQRNPEECGVRK